MKKRYIYTILFGVPGFIIALILSFVLSEFAGGVLWLYVLGDNPWPVYTETGLAVFFVLVFLAVWTAISTIGFFVGRRLEQNPRWNKNHVLASIGVSILFVLFILFQQLSVGNLGPKSDGERCMDFCAQEGFSASSMPARDSGDRSCSCLDDSGNETIRVPVDNIETPK